MSVHTLVGVRSVQLLGNPKTEFKNCTFEIICSCSCSGHWLSLIWDKLSVGTMVLLDVGQAAAKAVYTAALAW